MNLRRRVPDAVPAAMPAATSDPLPRHVRATDAAIGAGAILQPGVNLWLWRRHLDADVIDAAGLTAASAPHSARVVAAIDERHAAIERLLDAHKAPAGPQRLRLAQDMASLAFLFARIAGLARVQIRLDAVLHEACPLFHVDSVPLRLLCTYVGAGTEWLADGDADHGELGLRGRSIDAANAAIRGDARVRTVPSGWVAICKGRRYGDATPGVVHRSPDPAGVPRLLLVIDQPMEVSA